MVLNLVDFAIIGVIVISILYALHGGFLNSLFNTFAMLLSCGIALLFTPSLASSFKENEAVMSTLLHYTEGASRIDNLELARSSVSSLSPDTLQQAVQNARFPHPFDQLLLENMQTLSLQSQDCVTLADYFNQTLVNVSLNILCFVLLFLVAFLLFTFCVGACNAAFRFPVLKHLDMLSAGCLGFLRGLFFLLVLFVLVPVALAVVPVDILQEFLDASSLSPMFYGDNPLLSLFSGI